ncbi:MAG: FIG00996362: hypothetical protein, partial [uncultured Nocardioidaceae bacterium]
DQGERQAHPADHRRARRCVRRPHAGRPHRLPGQVPEDGDGSDRVLPGHRVPVLRRRDRSQGPVGRRAQRQHLDPRGPARGELRHVHELRRATDVRRQRLRRGLHRSLHVGPATVRRQPRADGMAEGPAGGGDPQAHRPLPPRLPRAGRPLPEVGERRERLHAEPAQHRGTHPGAPAEGADPHPGRTARRHHVHRDRDPHVPGEQDRPASRQGGAEEGAPGLRRLPRDHPVLEEGEPAAVLRGARHGRQDRVRHRQRRAAGVQRPRRGAQPVAGQRRRAEHEAGQRAGRQPVRRQREGRAVLRQRGAPHGGQPAGAAGPHRPAARLDGARRGRLRRRRALAVRGGPRLGAAERALGDRLGGGAARPRHREGALRLGRGQ